MSDESKKDFVRRMLEKESAPKQPAQPTPPPASVSPQPNNLPTILRFTFGLMCLLLVFYLFSRPSTPPPSTPSTNAQLDNPGTTRPDGSIFIGTITIKGAGETSVRGLEGYCLHGARNANLIRNTNTEAKTSRYIFTFVSKTGNDVDVDFIAYKAGTPKCSYL